MPSGFGTLSVNTSTCEVGHEFTSGSPLILTYLLGAGNTITTSGGVIFNFLGFHDISGQYGGDRAFPWWDTPTANNIHIEVKDNDVTLVENTDYSVAVNYRRVTVTILETDPVTVLDGDVANTHIKLTYYTDTDNAKASRVSTYYRDGGQHIWRLMSDYDDIDPGSYYGAGSDFISDVSAVTTITAETTVKRINIACTPNPINYEAGETIDIKVTCVDKCMNQATGWTGTVALSAQEADGSTVQTHGLEDLVFGAGDYGRKVLKNVRFTSLPGDGTRLVRIVGSISGGSEECYSGYVYLNAGEPKYRIYWGDFHIHSITDHMDKQHDILEPLRYLRYVTNAEWGGLGDHDRDQLCESGIWAAYCSAVNGFHDPGNFTTLLAWEHTKSTHHSHCVLCHDLDNLTLYSEGKRGCDVIAQTEEILAEKYAQENVPVLMSRHLHQHGRHNHLDLTDVCTQEGHFSRLIEVTGDLGDLSSKYIEYDQPLTGSPGWHAADDTRWIASGSEYYLEWSEDGATGWTIPTMNDEPYEVLENGSPMTKGTVGSLALGEWGWANNTIYVRLSDGADPDSKADGYVSCRARGARVAWENDYFLGVAGGTDCHDGQPGKIFFDGAYGDNTVELCADSGLTGVWAKSGSRMSVWQGLYDRRTIATFGMRMFLKFTVTYNGTEYWPGSIIDATDAEETFTIDVIAACPYVQASMYLVHVKVWRARRLSTGWAYTEFINGSPSSTTVYSDLDNDDEVQLAATPTATDADRIYYYAEVKCTQEGSTGKYHYAFSSPVWVKVT